MRHNGKPVVDCGTEYYKIFKASPNHADNPHRVAEWVAKGFAEEICDWMNARTDGG